MNALAPEIQPDGFTYHLGLASEFVRLGGFPARMRFYDALPLGMEMLFTVAFSFGRHAAAKLVEWMTGQTIETNVLKAGFALPTIKSIVNTQADWLNQNTPLNQNSKQLLENAQNGVSWFYGAPHTELVNDTTSALQAIMLNHADAKTQLDQAAQKVDTWIQQNGP